MRNNVILPYLNNEEYRVNHGYDHKQYRESEHHKLPRSRGGINTSENLIRLFDPIHVAFHRLYGNANFREQVIRLVKINEGAITEEIKEKILDVVKIEDDGYYFKNGVRRNK